MAMNQDKFNDITFLILLQFCGQHLQDLSVFGRHTEGFHRAQGPGGARPRPGSRGRGKPRARRRAQSPPRGGPRSADPPGQRRPRPAPHLPPGPPRRSRAEPRLSCCRSARHGRGLWRDALRQDPALHLQPDLLGERRAERGRAGPGTCCRCRGTGGAGGGTGAAPSGQPCGIGSPSWGCAPGFCPLLGRCRSAWEIKHRLGVRHC